MSVSVLLEASASLSFQYSWCTNQRHRRKRNTSTYKKVAVSNYLTAYSCFSCMDEVCCLACTEYGIPHIHVPHERCQPAHVPSSGKQMLQRMRCFALHCARVTGPLGVQAFSAVPTLSILAKGKRGQCRPAQTRRRDRASTPISASTPSRAKPEACTGGGGK